MAVAIDPKTPIPLVTKSDKLLPEEQRTTFYFLPFTRRELSKFQALSEEVKGAKADHVQSFIDILKDKFTGWRNFRRSDGSEIPFSQEDKESNFDMMSLQTLIEVFEGIIELNQLSVEQIKN